MDSEIKKLSFKSGSTEGFSLTVNSAGYEKCESLHSWGKGVRDHYLIHHITSGKGVFSTPSGSFELKAGDTFLIYPETLISYTADADDPWEYYWTGFSGADAEHIISRTDFTREMPVLRCDFGDELKDRMSEIYRCNGHTAADITEMTGRLYLMLALLMKHPAASAATGGQQSDYAETARQFISGSYSLDISVEDIAAAAGVSRATLFRAFRRSMGISPSEYLARFRIDRASELLRTGQLTVSETAASVGFEDSLYFSRVFKKYKGVSPSEYAAGKRRK